MNKLFAGLLFATAAALTSSSAFSQEIVLGYLPSGGGPFATFSKTNQLAAQMAVDEVNAAGGVNGKKLRITAFDTEGKPDQAVVGLRKLADDDKVMAIIGPFSSSECRVAFPAAERAGVPVMSMASSAPNLAEPFTFAFRNTSDEGYLFDRVMRALKEKNYPTKTAAIAYATDDVISKTMGEKVLPTLMQKAGTEIKLNVTFQSQAFDLAPQVSQLVAQRSAIRDQLRQIKDFPALEGAISFGKNGDALKPAYVIEMNDGKWNLIASYPPNS